jgi:hypothetical protein
VALALAALALRPTSATAQDVLRWSPKGGPTYRDVQLYADDVTTWIDHGRRAFLVRGNAWLTHDQSSIHFQQGVLWVTETTQERSPAYQLQVYAEGAVQIEESATTQQGERAVLELGTRGHVKVHRNNGRLAETPAANDPLFQRAVAALGGVRQAAAQVAPGAPAVVPAVAVAQSPVPAEPVQQTPVPAVSPPSSSPGVPTPLPAPRPVAGPLGAPPGSVHQFTIRPRFANQEIQAQNYPQPNGEFAVVINTGVIINITNPDPNVGDVDIEADRVVTWTRGGAQQLLGDPRGPGPRNDTLEFYLAGHVEIRTKDSKEMRLLRADEAYYDVHRHVAVALHAGLEITDPKILYPILVQGDELFQLNENLFQANHAIIGASALPWDPGLRAVARETTFESKIVERKTIFGFPFIDLATGKPVVNTERYFRSRDVTLELEGIPFFYTPYLAGDVEHPLGPLESIGVNYNSIFGVQLSTTWDMFQLLGISKIPDTRWRLYLDYLSKRGPAIGSEFEYHRNGLFGIPGRYEGDTKFYVIYDTGTDVIGGTLGTETLVSDNPMVFVPVNHPDLRGRFYSQNSGYDMPYGFEYQFKVSALSDQNFLRQYYQTEWMNGPNQDTFLYVKQQEDFWAWTFLMQPTLINWETETAWLPRLEGYGLGISLFDLLTYNVKASAGYAKLTIPDVPPPPVSATDQNVNTARIDLWQDISLPLTLGSFKVVPYGILDLTYYSEDLNGDQTGRVYGAGGVRTSFPLSRLYPDVHSELFNVNGIYHKITFSGNFFTAFTNVHYTQLPQLDQLNDNSTDESLRQMFLWQQTFNPSNATFLTTSPLFDPQAYAVRRIVLSQIDTRDDVEVVQLDINQRWQTKRGLPGNEHVVDWMTLDLSASFFPRPNRDNFGETVAFLEYDWLWNIGDRTSLVSTGWVDGFEGGPRVFTIGANFNRPDRTNLYLGYRQIDPLQSRSVIASLTYPFSPKYAVTASTNWDFGTDTKSYSLVLTRVGTDLTISAGLTFTSSLNNTVGFVFEVLPNLAVG